jgi:hypothetical protein
MNRCRDQTRASGTAAPTRDSLNRNHQSSSCRYLTKLRLEAQSSCLSFLIYGLTNKALFVGYERAPLAAKFRVKMPSPCPIKRCGDRFFFRYPPIPYQNHPTCKRIVLTLLECEGNLFAHLTDGFWLMGNLTRRCWKHATSPKRPVNGDCGHLTVFSCF